MISHITHVFDDMAALDITLRVGPVVEAAKAARSILVQVYCDELDPAFIRGVTSCICKRLPQSVVVGATSAGEIARGRLLSNKTIIGFTFFGSSGLMAIALPCEPGREYRVGAELGRRIAECSSRVAGVLLLATPLSIDASSLLAGLGSVALGLPVFGGGAGDYVAMKNSLVFTSTELFSNGAVAVALTGEDLHVEVQTYLGWRPLSRSMRVTEVEGMLVKRIDDAPAFDIYKRYLGITLDQDFSPNAMEFPMLLEREGTLVARIPASVTGEGALQMIADIDEGETFRMDAALYRAKDLGRNRVAFAPPTSCLYEQATLQR